MSTRMILLVTTLVSLTLAVPETHRHAPHKTDHFGHGQHNPVFDQEALLGSHKFEELADLPDDVRLKRLQNLAKSHDKNNNGIIESEELEQWVLESFRMLDREEALEKMEEEDEDGDGKVTFNELLHKQYGYTPEEGEDMLGGKFEEDEADVVELLKDDKERFQAADLDKDGSLTEAEYLAFFQPYDYPHMYEVEMAKTMREFDKDKDGFVSLEEFVADETDEESRLASTSNFEENDKDKDGQLTAEELRPYALPDNSDSAKDEAEHLINMCDEDKDGSLSIDEIVSKEDEFLSSTATDFGRNLHFVKDEL